MEASTNRRCVERFGSWSILAGSKLKNTCMVSHGTRHKAQDDRGIVRISWIDLSLSVMERTKTVSSAVVYTNGRESKVEYEKGYLI